MNKAHPRIAVDLIQQYADGGIGAEVGVFKGMTSNYILEKTKTKLLYMVDRYESYDENQGTYGTSGKPGGDFRRVSKRFKANYPDRHILINKPSHEASLDVNVDLDFVFIDANHNYEYVLQDLNCWVSKVKSGGLVMGHDWWRQFPGVQQAVEKYSKNNVFIMPPNPKPINKLPRKTQYIPAPSKTPVVFKSWPEGHVWWALKK